MDRREKDRSGLKSRDSRDVSSLRRGKDSRAARRSRTRSRSPEHRQSSKKQDRRSRSRSPRHSESKKKKRRHRSSSSSSASSTSSSSQDDKGGVSKSLLKKLEEKRKQTLEEKRKWKEQMKALETPEEKRRRRLLKKEAKERKRKEQMGWDSELLHYTNADNPFGDSNLLDKFIWKKKFEKEGKIDLTPEQLEKEMRFKQMANREELEKVKRRRQEREIEKAAREQETALEQRQKEADQFREWQKQEDHFHLEQARLRSLIRIQDGRAKPIDLLAKYISTENDPDAVEMNEPYFYLTGLTIADLEDLIADIQVYMELEKESNNIDYWKDLQVIVEEELRAMRKLEQTNRSEYEAALGRREGIHSSVAQDVLKLMKGKTAAQLVALQAVVERKVASPQEGSDVSYWESVLSLLKAHMAKARLRDRHQANLKRKLEMLKSQQGIDQEKPSGSSLAEALVPVKKEPEESVAPSAQDETEVAEEEDQEETEGPSQAEEDILGPCLEAYESGRYSPTYLNPATMDADNVIVTAEEDSQQLELSRSKVLRLAGSDEIGLSAEDRILRDEARKGMTADEAIFSVESTIDKPVYLWSDKYRPRKPRYFNRVHTGFEWNKYNQTHYDMDNPPPKVVQGYKFNIFYPDLIDKNCTPQYTVTACADNKDFAILRFRAGPPYEDIAFKIVNREWEYSYKKGFRCQFHNNIMQLWFHFKRYRYRR